MVTYDSHSISGARCQTSFVKLMQNCGERGNEGKRESSEDEMDEPKAPTKLRIPDSLNSSAPSLPRFPLFLMSLIPFPYPLNSSAKFCLATGWLGSNLSSRS